METLEVGNKSKNVTNYMIDPDVQIIEQVLAGDKKAYTRLIDRHKDKAMTLALRMLKNREDAEEALQDAFVRAFNALPRFEWKSSFSTWFYRIVFNVCATALGKRSGEAFVSVDAGTDEADFVKEIRSDDPTPDVDFESREVQAIVQEEIERLPEVYGSTFTLFVLQEMSYDEIVTVTGAPLGTVKARLFRARMMLQEALKRRLRTGHGPEVAKENAA